MHDLIRVTGRAKARGVGRVAPVAIQGRAPRTGKRTVAPGAAGDDAEVGTMALVQTIGAEKIGAAGAEGAGVFRQAETGQGVAVAAYRLVEDLVCAVAESRPGLRIGDVCSREHVVQVRQVRSVAPGVVAAAAAAGEVRDGDGFLERVKVVVARVARQAELYFPHAAVHVGHASGLAVVRGLCERRAAAGLRRIAVAVAGVADLCVIGVAQRVVVAALWEIRATAGVIPRAVIGGRGRLAVGHRQHRQRRALEHRGDLKLAAARLSRVDGAVVGIARPAVEVVDRVVVLVRGQRVAVFDRAGGAALVRALIFVDEEPALGLPAVFEGAVQCIAVRVRSGLVDVGGLRLDADRVVGRDLVVEGGYPAHYRAVGVLIVAIVAGIREARRQGTWIHADTCQGTTHIAYRIRRTRGGVSAPAIRYYAHVIATSEIVPL